MTARPAKKKACAACPWRLSNQGTRHPDGWYTKANLRRLWSKLRRGDSMTCHPTDPTNPVPAGSRPVPDGTPTYLCTGAEILKQRHYMSFQTILQAGGTIADYRRANPRGLTVEGAWAVASEFLMAGMEGQEPALDLGDDEIGHPEVPCDFPPRRVAS